VRSAESADRVRMAREPTLEETFQELEATVRETVEKIERLQAEKARLVERIERLERERAQAVERINIILDRIESLG